MRSTGAQHKTTYVLYILCHTPPNMFVERGPNFATRDMLQSRKDRGLNLGLDSHLHHACRVPRKLGRDQLENLFLSINVVCLFVRASLVEPLL